MRFYTISFGSKPPGSSPFQGVANRRRGFGRSSLLPCASPLWSDVNDQNWYGCNVALVPLFPKCILFSQICPDLKKSVGRWIWDCRNPPWFSAFLDAIYSDICYIVIGLLLWHLEFGKHMALGYLDLPPTLWVTSLHEFYRLRCWGFEPQLVVMCDIV